LVPESYPSIEADDYAHGGHQEIFYKGAVNAMFRKEAREFAPHTISELDRDYPKIVVDLTCAASAFCTYEEMQQGEGIAPWDFKRLAPKLDYPARVWSIKTWYHPPETFQEAVYVFTSLREINQLVRMGLCFCPLPEEFYPIRYYGAYGEHEQEGCIAFKEMDNGTGYCVYRA
jgi:hypothetical protein